MPAKSISRKPTKKVAPSKDDYSIVDSLIIVKQNPGGLMIVREDDDKFFFRVQGDLACETFELLRKKKNLTRVIEQMTKSHVDAPPHRLRKDIQKLARDLVKHKLFTRA